MRVGVALAAALLALLSGCQAAAPSLRGRLHILVSSPSRAALDHSLERESLEGVRFLLREFNQLHPHVAVSLSVMRDSELEPLLARRQAMGLAPDLVLSSGGPALNLAARGLSEPVALPAALRRQLDPLSEGRLARTDGRLAAVPMALHPDLACFNRSTTGQPPRRIHELRALEARGLESGMAIDGHHLYWSAGALGADGAIAALLQGQPASGQHRAAIRRWLGWLIEMNQVAGLYVLNSLNDLVSKLERGQLDWVMCNSASLPRLRQAMGAKLGVAVLPSGPAGPATRILRHQVWSFGRQSDQRQRQLAEALVRFSVKPPFQALFSLANSSSVPVNTVVASELNNQDPAVRAMAEASQHSPGSLALNDAINRHHQQLEAMNRVVRQVIDAELSLEEGTARFIAALQGGPRQQP